ncbi:unnamed protein product [Larinioides sclopetarius]|uniref:Uncharacterized protein n=1 Tax=Larinioides sclopetarius TaxID=280406 RepID=A0AAV2B0G6_9ARAC
MEDSGKYSVKCYSGRQTISFGIMVNAKPQSIHSTNGYPLNRSMNHTYLDKSIQHLTYLFIIFA